MEKLDKNKTLKKSGGWTIVFIIFIICFPILIEYGNYYFTHGTVIFSFSSIAPKLISIFKDYISFYATALTITFTVYSFTVQQRRIDEEREKKEEEREQREKDREEERKKEREKELELRIKELESKRDFYRPTFIVERKVEYDEVKLLMRDENLYLENVRYYKDDWHSESFKANLKSGSMLFRKAKRDKSFFISGVTQIGEQILFGYLKGGIKVHKYLKSGENALIPREGFNNYNQDEVDATWGTYNNDGSSDKVLEQVFFYNTIRIRERLVFTYYQSLKQSLQADSATNFFRNIFRGITEEYKNYSLDIDSVHRVVYYFLQEVKANQIDFEVDNQNISFYYLHNKLRNLNENVQKFSKMFTSDDFNLFEFTNLALETLQTIRNKHDEKEKLDGLLRIITQVFDNVKVSTESPLNNRLLMYKAELFNNLNWS